MTSEDFTAKVDAMTAAVDAARKRSGLNFIEGDEKAEGTFAAMLHIWKEHEKQMNRVAGLEAQMQDLNEGMSTINAFIEKNDKWYKRLLLTDSFRQTLADVKNDMKDIEGRLADAEKQKEAFISETRKMAELVKRAEAHWKNVARN